MEQSGQMLTLDRKDELVELLFDMLLIRRFEEKVAEMYTRAKVTGFVHLNIGEEGTVVGAIKSLRPEDYLFSTYREHGHALTKGVEPKKVMAELYGKVTGCSKGRGGSMHLFDAERRFMGGYAIVGGQIPVSLGVGQAIKYRGGREIVMTLMGDGTTNIGAFHECLNIAKLWSLPMVFVVVNNQYGMGTGVARASAVGELYKKACAYGMRGERTDGMDVLATHQCVEELVRLAREEQEPSLVEVMTYRYRGHSMTDPGRYRSPEEVRRWRERDAIHQFQERLRKAGIIADADVQATEDRVTRIVEEAVEFAEASPEPDPRDLYEYVYAEGEA